MAHIEFRLAIGLEGLGCPCRGFLGLLFTGLIVHSALQEILRLCRTLSLKFNRLRCGVLGIKTFLQKDSF